ncbi:MAG: hypothetical protein ACI86X_001773 [Moritella sp.]|jgi:hypothetical protein
MAVGYLGVQNYWVRARRCGLAIFVIAILVNAHDNFINTSITFHIINCNIDFPPFKKDYG